MKIKYNDIFLKLLKEYDLPQNLLFNCNIPKDVQKILKSEILQTELGITLAAINKLYVPTEEWKNRSNVADDANHFHVDWHASDSKGAFKLGVKTLVSLAEKFINEKIAGVRLTYSFHTPELSRLQSMDMHIHTDGDDYHFGDRLSFYQTDENVENEMDNTNLFESKYFAILIIDV